jgi:hypothetical protein
MVTPKAVAGAISALALLAAPASACPTCSVGQGIETLVFVLCFLVIPYLVVSAVWFWMRRVLASENADQ